MPRIPQAPFTVNRTYGVSRPTDELVGQTPNDPPPLSVSIRTPSVEERRTHIPNRGTICLSHEAREKRAHLRAHEIPRLAVLHQVHLAEGALAEHLDRLILLHPFSCDLQVPSPQPVSARFFDLLAHPAKASGGRDRRAYKPPYRALEPRANPVSRAEF